MFITIITVAVIAGLVIWVRFRVGAPRTSGASSKNRLVYRGDVVASESCPERDKGEFRAVTIDPSKSDTPCRMALDRINNSILMSDAPMLPLPDCDAVRCRCAYVRYDDRRQLYRRATHQMGEAICNALGIDNRRSLRNRRRID